ncbi:MAG: peptidase [Phenylobacterium sp.]|nr:peptidase [Phenylobacterium sp.]
MRLLPTVLAALLAPLACQAAPAGTSIADAHRMSENVRVLASDAFEGRGPATPGEAKTVDFLIGRFKALGLQPGGENGGWTQAVTLNRFVTQKPLTAAFRVGGEAVPLTFAENVVVQTRRPGADHVRVVDAPLVFVGYGVSAPERGWDDYKGVDLKGKVAVVLVNDPDFATPEPGKFGGATMTYYGRWTYKFEELARQGALGVLIVHETPAAGYPWYVVRNSWSAPQFDIPRDPRERALVEGWITRATAEDLFRRAGLDYDQLKLDAQKADFHPTVLKNATFSTDFNVQITSIVSRNVIAKLPGTGAPQDVVLYGAHWDHLGRAGADLKGDDIYNGAADNATGVAGLLELAHAFAQAPRTRRTVVFAAWTAEEKGLLGSEYYAGHPIYPLARTVANLNMDMLAIFGATRDVVITGAGKDDLEDDVAAAARAQGRVIDPEPHPEVGGYYRSDHFSLAKAGVPAVDMHAGPDLVNGGREAGMKASADFTANHYHQPSDEWRADWDLSGAQQDLDLLYKVGRDLAQSNRWPAWRADAEFKPARDASAALRTATGSAR